VKLCHINICRPVFCWDTTINYSIWCDTTLSDWRWYWHRRRQLTEQMSVTTYLQPL